MQTMQRHQDPVAAPIGSGYSTAQVAALTGLTYRQVDYYDRRGMFSPSTARSCGPGSRRVYSADDVDRGRLVAALRALGATFEVIARVLEQLPARADDWPSFLFIGVDGELAEYRPTGSAWWGVQTSRVRAGAHRVSSVSAA